MKNGVKWRISTLSPIKQRLISQIEGIGAEPYALNMWEKGVGMPVHITGVKPAAANIIKQEALASGIDAAVCRGTVSCTVETTDVIILGSIRGIKLLIPRLKRQGFSLPLLASELENLLAEKKPPVFVMRDKELILDKPYVMGILNITPDSFSDGGKYITAEMRDARIKQMLDEGAMFIDIGGVSTRPGHTVPSLDEELGRILPAAERALTLASGYNAFVSVDTWRYEAAKAVIGLGVDMINDQSALAANMGKLAALCAESKAGVCLMHGGPHPEKLSQADSDKNHETDIVNSVKTFFQNKTESAVAMGVNNSSIMIDPGFGFKKSLEDNYLLLKYLSELCTLGYPLLAGVSKKSMIGAATEKPVDERDFGTLAAETIAMMNGAAVIRTHNAGKCMDALKVIRQTGV